MHKANFGSTGANEWFVYDEQRRLIGVYDISSTQVSIQEELVYRPESWALAFTIRGQTVGVSGSAGVAYPILSDNIGTPRVVLDPINGHKRWTWEAKEAFGMEAPVENPQNDGNFVFNARFPGQWFDEETGLFQNGYRDYNPQTGRYMQSDPIGLNAGWNTYGYVSSSPIFNIDLFGLEGYLTIYSAGWGGISGHSWIEYKKLGSSVSKTYGTFGNGPYGLVMNHEKNNPNYSQMQNAASSRTMYLSDADEERLKRYMTMVRSHGVLQWTPWDACSSFAKEAWEVSTGETLNDRNQWGISTPTILQKSISELNPPKPPAPKLPTLISY